MALIQFMNCAEDGGARVISIILNKEELVSKCDSEYGRRIRRYVIEALEESLAFASSREVMRQNLTRVGTGKSVMIGKEIIGLGDVDRIFIVGAGVLAAPMALAFEDILGDKVVGGIVSVPFDPKDVQGLKKLYIQKANPLTPDDNGVRVAQDAFKYVEGATGRDVVFILLSSGASTMMCMPVEGVKTTELTILRNLMIKQGADETEISVVMNHLSAISGGWLPAHTKVSKIYTLVISDALSNDLNVIGGGPTCPDESTFPQALKILQKYNVWNDAPSSIKNYINKGLEGGSREIPKTGDKPFGRVRNFLLMNNRMFADKLVECIERRGINPYLMSSTIRERSAPVGNLVSMIGRDMRKTFKKPSALILSGNIGITSEIQNYESNIYTAFHSLKNLSGVKGLELLSVDTRGLDGMTDAAGALVDGNTLNHNLLKGPQVEFLYDQVEAYKFLKEAGSLIYTGWTGSDVGDVLILANY
jgi:glycerate 2-kinase